MTVHDEVRIDLHVHSSASDQPFNWLMKSVGAGECYTQPERVYQLAKRRGMTLVTLTDHDKIDGALEIAERHDDAFVSEEISARFPEDGCIVHVIALNITEAQHHEIQRLRRNIYELITYLDQADIVHFWCHPLSDVNHRLTSAHIERCLLMFRILEARNGTCDETLELRLRQLVDELTPTRLARWAEQYPQVPALNLDGKYNFVGGSDDHGGIAIARAFTQYDGQPTADDLCRALRAGEIAVRGENGLPSTFAHNVYGVIHGHLRTCGHLGDESEKFRSESLNQFVDKVHSRMPRADQLLLEAEKFAAESHVEAFQQQLREGADEAFVKTTRESLGKLALALGVGRVAEAVDALPEVVKSLLVELPYLLSTRRHVRKRNKAQRLATEISPSSTNRKPMRIGIVSDALDNVDGLAIGLRRLQRQAERKGEAITLITAGRGNRVERDDDGVVRVPTVLRHRVSLYKEYEWALPHLSSLVDHFFRANYALIQVSTPGPVGISALLAARLCDVPVIGQYHTDVPEYVKRLSGDDNLAAATRAIVSFMYRSVDKVLVPSVWAGRRLRDLGVKPENVSLVPRGIDLQRFSPAQRAPDAFAQYGIPVGAPIALYVGRVSREKSLPQVLDAFARYRERNAAAHLVVVGDGPLRASLEQDAPEHVVFTGMVTGENLARLYASADVFVFLSETETFGNVVVEAQASGLPVIVAEGTATNEIMVPGVTGFAVSPHAPDDVAAAMAAVLDDPKRQREMSRKAVRHAQKFDMEQALDGALNLYARHLEHLDRGVPRGHLHLMTAAAAASG